MGVVATWVGFLFYFFLSEKSAETVFSCWQHWTELGRVYSVQSIGVVE